MRCMRRTRRVQPHYLLLLLLLLYPEEKLAPLGDV